VKNKQQRTLKTVALIAVAMGLLLLLLVPHAIQHHDAALICFVLLPLFLFGEVSQQELLRPAEADGFLHAAPVLPCSFQRPPPSVLA
jgi:hypothetical protein